MQPFGQRQRSDFLVGGVEHQRVVAALEAHQQADRLQSEMAANGERMLALNDAQTEDYRGLARVRLALACSASS